MVSKRSADTVPAIPRAIVVLANARDRYQLPLALAEADLLDTLVTELYWPADTPWFAATGARVLPKRAVAARYREGLPSERVRLAKRTLVYVALARAGKRTFFNWRASEALSRTSRRLAVASGAPLFSYSYYAFEAFRESVDRPRGRFLFQLHPHPVSVRELLMEELERTPAARASLMMEQELALSPRAYEQLSEEPGMANGWVCASSYTAGTLAEQGIARELIHVVPYGVDADSFPARTEPPDPSRAFTAIFVGSMIQRKGLSDFLDAARLLKTKHLRVVVCGRGLVDEALLAGYADLGIEVKVGLPHDRLAEEIRRSDVFVLPSLAEGFGHVILETMACGLPVITTTHTAGPDVLWEGEHGFLVPIRSPEAIAERLSWGMDNRAELAEMGLAAARQARTFTWERFRAGIVGAYREMYRGLDGGSA